jgi:hypothetical protein
VAVALAAATACLAGIHDAGATTVPGRLYITSLRITDSAITAHIRRHVWASTIHYRRGAEVRYEVVNRGTRAYSLDILGSATGRLTPGKRTSILVYWGRRGHFVFRAAPRGARLSVVVG